MDEMSMDEDPRTRKTVTKFQIQFSLPSARRDVVSQRPEDAQGKIARMAASVKSLGRRGARQMDTPES
jgi:hypothetical protein